MAAADQARLNLILGLVYCDGFLCNVDIGLVKVGELMPFYYNPLD
jgi:hypothetical protein